MSFADAYLLKAGLRDTLIETEPHPDLKIIVTIPVYNESGLERCLDSLFQCTADADLRAEVILLINAPAEDSEASQASEASEASEAILSQNFSTYEAVLGWITAHPHPSIDFHVLLDHSFSKKEAGVGLARKILMDEAARRFSAVGTEDGIIASMDADAVVEENYLVAIADHFGRIQPDGCSIYFEHPLSGDIGSFDGSDGSDGFDGSDGSDGFDGSGVSGDSGNSGEIFSPEVYDAITQYELHLRYYLQSLRSTGYPNAYHTVGSSFAVKADVYCKEGGMNCRQAGEDFYFIQKVAQRGNFSECNTTRVIPSARPSDRVPFGTGAAVGKLIKGDEHLSTYDPRPFGMLGHLFSGLETMYTEVTLNHFMKSQPDVLVGFLDTQQFGEALVEIRKNSASFPAFQKRFWRWFNMFRIMKFLHHARENGFPDIPVGEASLELLRLIKPEGVKIPSDGPDLKELLKIFRKLDRLTPD